MVRCAFSLIDVSGGGLDRAEPNGVAGPDWRALPPGRSARALKLAGRRSWHPGTGPAHGIKGDALLFEQAVEHAPGERAKSSPPFSALGPRINSIDRHTSAHCR